MALPDPLVLTYSGAAKSLAKIDDGSYRLVDGGVTYTVVISTELPAKNKRNRLRATLKRESLLAIPELTGQSEMESLSVSVAADFSRLHSPADAQLLYNALLTWLTSATFLKVAGGET